MSRSRQILVQALAISVCALCAALVLSASFDDDLVQSPVAKVPGYQPRTGLRAATWIIVDDDDNQPDVRPFVTLAMEDLDPSLAYDVWDTANSDLEPTLDVLNQYDVVVWFTGGEFGGFAGPGPAAESALTSWLHDHGGCLVISSQDYHFDRGLTAFMNGELGVFGVVDDTGHVEIAGAPPIFGGLDYSLAYPVPNHSDEVIPSPDARAAFVADSGTAAVMKDGDGFRTVFLAFPFSSLPTAAARESVMRRSFAACTGGLFFDSFESGDTSVWSGTAEGSGLVFDSGR